MTEPVATIVELKPCIVKVNRSPVRLPWWATAEYPELATRGPSEYDLNKVEKLLHDGQKCGKRVVGYEIRAALEKYGLLRTCLRLQDIDCIQRKGAVFYKKHFTSEDGTPLIVPAWAAMVTGCPSGKTDMQYVPALREAFGDVQKIWVPLSSNWAGNAPAFMFPKQ